MGARGGGQAGGARRALPLRGGREGLIRLRPATATAAALGLWACAGHGGAGPVDALADVAGDQRLPSSDGAGIDADRGDDGPPADVIAPDPPDADGSPAPSPDLSQSDSSETFEVDPEPEPAPTCPGPWTGPVAEEDLPIDTLQELSGLAASVQSPGVLWAHNDSGAGPVLEAVDLEGRHRATLHVGQDYPLDWEGLDVARCPQTEEWCLWVGDIGDNPHIRPEVAVWVIPEPPLAPLLAGEPAPDPVPELQALTWTIYPFHYPGESVDSEALVVSEAGGELLVVEKIDGAVARLFTASAPFSLDTPTALEATGSLLSPGIPVPWGLAVTGGDRHPEGGWLALRLYTGTWAWPVAPETPLGGLDLVDVAPVEIALGPLDEPQGEAVTWDAAGLDLWTISEDPAGFQPMHRYPCDAP